METDRKGASRRPEGRCSIPQPGAAALQDLLGHGAAGALLPLLGQPQALLPPHLAQRLSGHQGIMQFAIESLGHPPQGGERDGVRRLGLLQLAHPRRRDSQALAQRGRSHAQSFADGPQPAHRRPWRQGVAGGAQKDRCRQ